MYFCNSIQFYLKSHKYSLLEKGIIIIVVLQTSIKNTGHKKMEKETKIILQFIVTKDIFEIKKDRKKRMFKYYINCVEFGTPK